MSEPVHKNLFKRMPMVATIPACLLAAAAGYRLEKGELKNQEWVSPSLNSTHIQVEGFEEK